MDLGSLFILLSIFVLVAAFVSRPFVVGDLHPAKGTTKPSDSPIDREQSTLLAEYERLLNALQELDFDYALGKIPAEDYPGQRAALLQSAAGVLRRLDSFAEKQPPLKAEDRLEAAIAAHRADAVALAGEASSASGAMDELEAMIVQRRAARREKSAGFCPHCGRPVQKSDVFCSKCGAKLA